jgi:hypothetical protein
MGVYLRKAGATPTYLELTQYTQFEEGETTWEIGTSVSDMDQDPIQFSSAYLGVNPDVQKRLGAAPVTTTPTLGGMAIGTGGSANNQMTYTYEDGSFTCVGDITFGTAGTTLPGATALTINLPGSLQFAGAITSVTPIGQCTITAGGVAYNGTIRIQSAGVARILAINVAGTYATPQATSALIPGTWAAGDSIRYSFAAPVTG